MWGKKTIEEKPVSVCFVLFVVFQHTESSLLQACGESQTVSDVVAEAEMSIKKPKGELFCKKVFLISIPEISTTTFSRVQ